MLPETKNLISKLFSIIQEGEKKIEIKRKNLNESIDFEPYILFNRLDQFRKNYLNEENFINFLKLNNIEVTINQGKFLILFYDSDSTQNLNYNQFLNLVLSNNYYEIRNLINSKIEENINENNNNDNNNNLNNSLNFISYETEKLFCDLLKSEFDLIKNIDLTLSEIKSYGDFSLTELFNESNISGIVISKKLNQFISSNGINLDNEDIKLILKRFDIKKNGRVDLFDLEKIFYFPYSTPPSRNNSIKKIPKIYKNYDKNPFNLNQSRNIINQDSYNKYFFSNPKKNVNSPDYHFNHNNKNYQLNHYNENINENFNDNNSNDNENISDDDFENKYEEQFNKTFNNKLFNNENKYTPTFSNDENNVNLINTFKNSNGSMKNFFRNNQSNLNESLSDKNNINKKLITQYKFPNKKLIKNSKYNNDNNNSFSTQLNSDQEIFQRSSSQINIGKHNHIKKNKKLIPLCNNSNKLQNNQMKLSKIPRLQNYIFNTENIKNFPKKISTTLSLRLSPIRKGRNEINNNNNSQIINNNKNNNSFYQREFNEYDLLNLLENIIEIELEIEKEKIKISKKKDYNIEDIFSFFESNLTENNILSKEDLLNGFNNLNLDFNLEDLNIILFRFDLKNLGGLSYSDFFDMLVPFDKKIRDEVENRFSFGLSNETLENIRNLFILILTSEKKINDMKNYIKSLYNVNIPFIFNNYISFNNIFANDFQMESYLKKNGIFINQKGADLLFIRLDKNRDGKFTLDDFLREVL